MFLSPASRDKATSPVLYAEPSLCLFALPFLSRPHCRLLCRIQVLLQTTKVVSTQTRQGVEMTFQVTERVNGVGGVRPRLPAVGRERVWEKRGTLLSLHSRRLPSPWRSASKTAPRPRLSVFTPCYDPSSRLGRVECLYASAARSGQSCAPLPHSRIEVLTPT